MMNFVPQKDPWYSPIKVITEFEKLRARYGDKRLEDGVFQRAREMFAGAATLLGAFELSDENKYWLQSNSQSPSPDVVACKRLHDGNGQVVLNITQMEVVELEKNSPTTDVVEFLVGTKLSPPKAYTDTDMIVLTINRKIPYDPRKVGQQLAELNPKSTIYIIGRPVGAKAGDFMISTPFPKLYKPVHFNLEVTAAKYSIPETVNFSLSSRDEIMQTASGTLLNANTYDILGLERDKIYSRFGIKPKPAL